jgi:hypothetical protein
MDINGNQGDASFTNEIDMNDNKIINLGDPTALKDATNKDYVDTLAGGFLTNPMTVNLDMGTNDIINCANITLSQQAVFNIAKGTDTMIAGTANAGALLTSSADTVIIGDDSGTKITTAGNATFIGADSGKNLTGVSNTCIGFDCGTGVSGSSTGIQNTFTGVSSGNNLTTGAVNVGVGFASNKSTTGDYNSCLGGLSGSAINGGDDNTLIGYSAGFSINGTSDNTCVGSSANVSGSSSNSIAIGKGASISSSNACVIGNTSLTSINPMNTNTNCVLGGAQAFKSINLTDQAVFDVSDITGNMVARTGTHQTIGDNSLIIGYEAGTVVGSATHSNTLLGKSAGQYLNGANNTCIGLSSGKGNIDGTSSLGASNTMVGVNAGLNIELARQNVCLGLNSGSLLVGLSVGKGSDNVLLGVNAGNSITEGVGNVAVGLNSDCAATLDNQIAIGGGATTTLANTCVIGNTSITDISPGVATCTLGGGINFKSIALTDQAVFEKISSTSLVVGDQAGDVLTAGFNTFISDKAGSKTVASGRNVFVGYNSGRFSTGGNNVALGVDSFNGVDTFTTGDFNVCIGDDAGDGITTGDNNVCIGGKSDCLATADNQIAIGFEAVSATANTAVIGNTSLTSINPGVATCSLGAETPFNNININGDVIKNGVLYGVFTFFSQMTSKSVLGSAPSTGDLFDVTNARGGITYTGGTFVQGSTNRLVMGGSLETNGNNQLLQLEMRVGTAIAATTTQISLQNLSGAGHAWHLDMTFAIRQIGGLGVAVISSTGIFNWSNGSTGDSYSKDIDVINNTTFRTDTTQDFSVIVTWGSVSASNIITCHNAVASKWF